MTERKKKYSEMAAVIEFMAAQSEEIKIEYDIIVEKLEQEGRLAMPHAEKISGENLYAIRVIHAGNVRIFYVYGEKDYIHAIHAYEKKTNKIPRKELDRAHEIIKHLRKARVIK